MDQAAGGPPAAAPSDQTSCPSYVGDLVAALAELLGASTPLPGGVYHLTTPDYASRYEWACEIGRLAAARGLLPPGCLPAPALAADFPSGAPRPAFSALDSSRLRSRGIGLPSWRIGLTRYFDEVYGPAQRSGPAPKQDPRTSSNRSPELSAGLHNSHG
jgi:dTDP-4-dehydrorhamnose reductase